MPIPRDWIMAAAVLAASSASAMGQAGAAGAPAFVACRSTYALCTFAACKTVDELGSPMLFSCACNVRENEWSVGAKPCADPVKNAEGQTIVRSRYHPITRYARCTNSRAWAMCLDSPCVVDKADPTKANCMCSMVAGAGDYLVDPATNACTQGAISSATVEDLDQITDFLESQPNLLPPDMTVVNKSPK
jgi:hypothetical protein